MSGVSWKVWQKLVACVVLGRTKDTTRVVGPA